MSRLLRSAGIRSTRRGRALARLLSVARPVGPGLGRDEVFQALVGSGARLRSGAICTLRLVEPVGSMLRVVAMASPPASPIAAALDDHLSGQVLRRARPLLIRDARIDPRVGQPALWRAGGYSIYYGVPLPRSGRALGVLSVALPSGATPPTRDEQRLLQLHAAHAGLVADNTELAASFQQHTAALDVANAELLDAARWRTVGDLVGDVVHQASNLLATITLRTETLRERTREPEITGQLRALDTHWRQIRDLIGELRRLSEPGGSEPTAVDMGAAVDRILWLRAARMPTCGIRVVRKSFGTLSEIQGDRPQLERALLAVVLDAEAALAAAHGGVLTVRTGAAERRDGRWMILEVEDTGPSIAPHLLPHLFDAFAPRESGRGPSLGLAAAHAIVRAHHGRLSATNRPAGGVIFRLELPASS